MTDTLNHCPDCGESVGEYFTRRLEGQDSEVRSSFRCGYCGFRVVVLASTKEKASGIREKLYRALISEQQREIRLTKEQWANVILADFQTENNRTKADEWAAAFAHLFKQLQIACASKREAGCVDLQAGATAILWSMKQGKATDGSHCDHSSYFMPKAFIRFAKACADTWGLKSNIIEDGSGNEV